jgi:hypothetical protein
MRTIRFLHQLNWEQLAADVEVDMLSIWEQLAADVVCGGLGRHRQARVPERYCNSLTKRADVVGRHARPVQLGSDHRSPDILRVADRGHFLLWALLAVNLM